MSLASWSFADVLIASLAWVAIAVGAVAAFVFWKVRRHPGPDGEYRQRLPGVGDVIVTWSGGLGVVSSGLSEAGFFALLGPPAVLMAA
jgi:Na+/serine symporter